MSAESRVPRADNIGSMLRPPTLLAARAQHQAGTLDDRGLKAVEDRAVDFCVAAQELSGIGIVTDGEMRRNVFSSSLAQAAMSTGERSRHAQTRTVVACASASRVIAGSCGRAS